MKGHIAFLLQVQHALFVGMIFFPMDEGNMDEGNMDEGNMDERGALW